MSLAERLQHRIARSLNGLPHRVQVLLGGGRPVVRDGLTLHPEVQLILALRRLSGGQAMSSTEPVEGRRRLRREALLHRGEEVQVGAVQDLVIDLPDRSLPARHYAPPGNARAPLLLFLHGGGFVLGDLETHDSACRLLCRYGEVQVLAVDYRLAPEAAFPAAVEDALASYRWACAHAERLGADPARIAVGGDSSGGNLAAVIALSAREEALPAPALQLLIYPVMDRNACRPSEELFAEGFFLTRADVHWFHQHYSARQDPDEPRLWPLRAKDLSGLSPALVVTAGFDPLRDEGEAYAAALEAAGTPVTLRRHDGLIHGFINLGGVSRACRSAVIDVARTMNAMLTRPVRPGEAPLQG